MRLFRSSFPHLRWLACLLAVLLLFGQQGALRHALSHLQQGGEGGTEIGVARAPAGKAAERAGHTGTEHAACLQCAAFAALAVALPVLAIFRLRNTRRWHFPSVRSGACALVFPVPVRSRDPPFSL